jgi:dihydropteroate synthase
VPLTIAIDPDLNIRSFATSSTHSVLAVEEWMGSPPAEDLGANNLVIESLDSRSAAPVAKRAAEAGVVCHAGSDRLWLTSSYPRLQLLAQALKPDDPRLGAEMQAALEASLSGGARRRPTLIMGILNVTPDSFSDGGLWLDHEAAVGRGLEMAAEGAHIIDVGGESTRPGAVEVPAEEELRRVLPVVKELRAQTDTLISIDTRKAAVAAPCLDAGANWVNDVSGLTSDPALAKVVAGHPDACLVLMHSRAQPSRERYSTEYDEQGRPVYEDVVADTLRWLRRQACTALDAGVRAERLWLDPGFGFGKTFEQNIELLRRLQEYTSTGLPVLVGPSRKSTVGRLLGDLPPDQRVAGTAATVTWAIAQGAAAVRVHDVREMVRVARVADALR